MSEEAKSLPSLGRDRTNRVRWPVSEKPISTKPIFLMYVSLPLLMYTYVYFIILYII